MDSFVGNSKIVSEIKKIISNQTVSNAYLFSGTDGIGKFTLSKIFAKAILCENPLNGAPCGKCEACLTFDSMADLIIIEPEDELIKIEKIRYAISELMLKPTISNKKVCIINDADCMNSSSQNALLKVLEEPPTFVTIILITSNKEKILHTIKSRCVTFNFLKLTDEEIKKVLHEEDINEDILKLSNGSVGNYLRLKNADYIDALLALEESITSKDLLEINKVITNLKKGKTIKEDIYDILDLLIIKLGDKLTDNFEKNAEKVELVEEVRNNLLRNANFDACLNYLGLRLYEINNKIA